MSMILNKALQTEHKSASNGSGGDMQYVIGVDIGTQSTKALLTDCSGRIIVQHTASYQPDTPRPLWAEQWPQVWLEAVEISIAGCMAQARAQGIAPSAIAALCI